MSANSQKRTYTEILRNTLKPIKRFRIFQNKLRETPIPTNEANEGVLGPGPPARQRKTSLLTQESWS